MKRSHKSEEGNKCSAKRRRTATPKNATEAEQYVSDLITSIQKCGNAEEKERLLQLLKKKAKAGSPAACFCHGILLHREDKKEKAGEMFRKAAEGGHLRACFNWAQYLHLGLGGVQNRKKALELLQKCALEHGMVEAYYKLGQIYHHGQGVDKDLAKAFAMYSVAETKGHQASRMNVAAMVFYGEGVAVDKERAFELYKSLAKGGNVTAQYNYAVMRTIGDGCAVNKEKALKYMTRSAEGGNASALHALGLKAALTDPEAAFRYYFAAAQKGHRKAQFLTAKAYEEGLGVEKNLNAAFHWYGECTSGDEPK